ncbi:hypothetical protein BVZ80_00594B, partial [Haemophilus influenzae]
QFRYKHWIRWIAF